MVLDRVGPSTEGLTAWLQVLLPLEGLPGELGIHLTIPVLVVYAARFT